MEIKSITYPSITLVFTNNEIHSIDISRLLDELVPDRKSPYRKILNSIFFNKVYVQHNKLIWDSILENVMCGGDKSYFPVEFGEIELLNFLKKSKHR